MAYDGFCEAKHPGWSRVVAAENTADNLEEECWRRKAKLVADVGDRRVEKANAGPVPMGCHKGVKSCLQPRFARMATHSFRHVGKGTFCLLEREQPELKEATAGGGRQEVGIAATGVEHHPIGMAGGQAHQLVFELEWTELRQLGVIDSRHGMPPLRSELRSAAQGRSEACVCRKTLLTPGLLFHVRFVASRPGPQAGQLKVSGLP